MWCGRIKWALAYAAARIVAEPLQSADHDCILSWTRWDMIHNLHRADQAHSKACTASN